jgi:RNA polymerase sigma-70 factor (ECF subfamily)
MLICHEPISAGRPSLSALRVWTDECLFEASRKGHDMAFRTLVDRHLQRVHRLAFNILGDEQEAEDAAQDAFLAAWRNRESWKPEAKFTTWLHRIAINKAIDRYRARRAAPESAETITRLADAALDPAHTPDQHRGLEQSQASTTLKESLNRLPDSQKLALTLFYFEDLDVARIAIHMGVSEQAVRSLLKRGRLALKSHLQKQKKLCQNGPLGPQKAPGDSGR